MTEEVIEQESAPETQVENAAVTEEVAESEPAKQPEKTEEMRSPKAERKISKLTKEKFQALAELEVARRELESLKAQQAKPAASGNQGMPKLEQFDNFDDYVAAKAEWVADQKLTKAFAEREKAETERKQSESQRKLADSWQKKVSEVSREIPDFAEVIESADVPMTQDVAFAVMESDMGPQIAYWLALNPEEAERLSEMSPAGVNRFLGKLEAKLEAEKVAKKKSDAPKPATPIKGSSSSGEKDPDKMSPDEWMRWRNKQLKAKYG